MGEDTDQGSGQNPKPLPKNLHPAAHLIAYRFPKGVVQNPGGRPKGLAASIRALTGDGKELIEILLDAARGTMQGIRPRDRIEATKTLLERGYGKPEQEIKVSTGNEALQLAPDHLELIARALATATPLVRVDVDQAVLPDVTPGKD